MGPSHLNQSGRSVSLLCQPSSVLRMRRGPGKQRPRPRRGREESGIRCGLWRRPWLQSPPPPLAGSQPGSKFLHLSEPLLTPPWSEAKMTACTSQGGWKATQDPAWDALVSTEHPRASDDQWLVARAMDPGRRREPALFTDGLCPLRKVILCLSDNKACVHLGEAGGKTGPSGTFSPREQGRPGCRA